MSKVEEALKAREERRKKEQDEKYKAKSDKISAALESRKSRMQSNSQSAVSDFATRIKDEIEVAKKISTPSWSKDAYDQTWQSTKNNIYNVSRLTRELDSYKSYIDEDTYNTLSSPLSALKGTYDSYLSLSEAMGRFNSEAEFNNWYEEAKKMSEEEQRVLFASDFDEYSQRGASVENPSWNDSFAPIDIFGWKPFGDGAQVNNMVTFAKDNEMELVTQNLPGEANDDRSSFLNYINLYMTDTEKSIYNYYIGKGDSQKAEEYLESLKDSFAQRHAGVIVEQAEGNILEPILAFSAGFEGALAGFGNIDNLIMGTEADPTSALQYANATMMGNNEGIAKVGSDVVHSIGNMLPSVLVSVATANPTVGAVTLGTSAAGNGYKQMRDLGYNEWQARFYGTAVGASEALLQKAIGGIGALGGKGNGIFQNLAGKVLPKIDNALGRIAIDVGSNMADEFVEEAVQSVLDPIFKMVATGEDFEGIDIEEVVYSGLLGALTAGAMEGTPTIWKNSIGSYKTGKAYSGNLGKTFNVAGKALETNQTKADKKALAQELRGALIDEALDIAPDNAHAQRMKTRLDGGKNVSGYQLNRLVEANESAMRSQDTTKIKTATEERLAEVGEKGDVGKLADILVKQAKGENLTRAERSAIKKSTYGQRVANELDPENIKSGKYASEWAENIGTERINADVYNKDGAADVYAIAVKQASATEPPEEEDVGKNTIEIENATEAKFEASTDGKTKIGDMEVSIKEIASVKDGEVILRLEDGSTVKASDVEYGSSDEIILYENVARMNLNAATANAFINGYDPSMSAELYAKGFDEAYRYGKYNFPIQEMSADGFSSMLTDPQRNLAYNLGKTDAKYNLESKQAKIASISAKNSEKIASKGTKKGKLHNTLKPTNERQKASLKALGVLAEGLGIDIYTFESPVVNGKRQGANGWYDPKDGSIHIDLYAGVDGKGTMLFTAAHELTHFIREWSPSKFKVFADFLLEQYGKKGISVDALVSEQIAKAKRNGRDISYDTAYEEVIADSCEAMLADGDVISKIADLKAKDKTLWQKIKSFLSDLVERIKAVYKGMTPDSVEGRYVAEMLDKAEKLKALWTEALVEASELSNAVVDVIEADAKPISNDEIITDGAVVTDGKGEKYSIRSMKHDITDGQMFRDLMNHCGFTKAQVGELRSKLEDLVEYMNPFRDIVDLNETYGREGRRYSPYKPNSDPLYTISLDFSTQCSKRLLTQYVIEQLQLRENRPMSPEEQMAIRDMLKEYGKVEKGLQVACVMCYVEAARLKAPKQIQKWLDDPATAMRNYFADKDPVFKDYIKKAQEDFKESKGYDRNATKKEMSAKDRATLNKIRPKLRAEYKPSAEEMAVIETASNLPNSTYLTAGNLADLSETHPEIYKAYTAFIRTATRSKALETDEPYYYGDSTRDNGNGIIVSDSFIEAVNRENGMRFSSWSDWRIQHLLDWITAVIDNSVRGAAMHGYTKYGDEVRVLGKTGMMFNMSGVAGTQTGLNEDGSLSFSETESMDYDEALALREEFPETAGLQCIGVGIDHIYALLRSDVIDYVIPYHTSGLNATLRRMGDIYGWKDFTQTQHATEDKRIKKENAVDPEHWHQEPVFSEFFVGYDTGLGGVEAMRKSAENYKRMCRERGLIPKFNEFAKEPNYWKLLIDRKMVNQKTNTLIKQKAVTPTFDFGVIKGIVDKYVANYDSGLEQRAFNHIVENWDNIPKRIRDLKKQGVTKAKSAKKAVDKLANQTVAVQPKGVDASAEIMRSDRDSYAPTFYSHMGKVVDGIKSDKVGANGVVPYLKGKGVKNEEIKWSGIEAFLEGKKSVTKAELKNFVMCSQLQIEEEISGAETWNLVKDGDNYIVKSKDGTTLETWETTQEPEDPDLKGWISLEGGDIASSVEEIREYTNDWYGSASTRWSQYRIDGGTNYRELVFRMPNTSYSNQAMRAHWGQDAEGVLVHARIQDITTNDGKKMLFVEELQSDYHNEGLESGYADRNTEAKIDKLKSVADNKFIAVEDYSMEVTGLAGEWETIEKTEKGSKLLREYREAQDAYDNAMNEYVKKIPDAPFRDTYHEYVLKRLIRMAAEEGYDSIGWTPADIQSKRRSYEYEKAYKIEYDQDIPSFLKKYGKRWGATVGKTDIAKDTVVGKERILKESELENVKRDLEKAKQELARKYDSYEKAVLQRSIDSMEKTVATLEQELSASFSVWSMNIPDSMKDSVLHEGQVLYSDRETFVEDKYFKSQMSKWEDLKHGSYVKVGTIGKKHPLYSVGMPDGTLRYDVDKLKKNMADHGDYLNVDLLKAIPDIIATPMAISEFSAENTVSVFGDIFVGNSPMMVGVTISKDRAGNDISKVRTYNTRRDVGKLITDESILYLNEDKKRTRKWFQACGIQVPLGETKFGFIRSISQKTDFVKGESEKTLHSDRDPNSFSNRSLLANALESVAQNDIERNKLKQYKAKIDLINSEQTKLYELREKIKELSFAKGRRDTEAIKSLQFEANQVANRINTYDRQLLNLESTKALKDVLDREKSMAYKKAEQRGKDALAAYRERATKTQRELMTRYQESRKKNVEGRKQTAMRHKIKDVVNELNQYLLKGTKDKHVPIELQKAVAEALDAVNMDTVGAEERLAKIHEQLQKDPFNHHLLESYRRISEQGERMDGKLQALKNAYDDIVNSDDPLIANSHDEVISNSIAKVIAEVGSTPLRDMTLTQLESVYDMYKMVLTTIRNTNKAFKAAKGEEISTIANGVIAELMDMKRKSLKQSKGMQAMSEFDWNNLKPIYAFERIGSANFSKVFKAVRDGEDVWAVDMTEAKDFSEEQRKKYKYDSWDFKKKYGFETKTGEKFELDLGEIMSLYAYAKDEHSKGHLTGDGFVFDPKKEVVENTKSGLKVKYNVEDATSYNISEQMLGEIIGTLTPDQKAFADAMQEYLSTVMGEKGNEVSLALYDIKLFKKKNYFPLKVSHAYMAVAKEKAQGDVKIKNKGFTKERKEGAKNSIVLTSFMDVWADHVNEMSMYHAFTLPLEDFYRVFNYTAPGAGDFAPVSVNSELINAHGNASVNYIEQLLKDLNGGARSDPRESFGKAMMANFKKASVIASWSVVIQQPSAIIRAQALVDAKHFVGKKATNGKHKEVWAEVKKYAPVAIIKEMGYFDTGMGKSSVEWLKGEKTKKDKVDDFFSKAPSYADEVTWCAIWNAVKRETLHTHKNLKPNSEEFLKAVGERFTEVITKTQVYDSTLARSANMRSKSAFMNMLTSFMAEPTTAINMLQDSFRKGKRGKYTFRVLGAVYGSVLLNSALVSIVYALRDDDEDETLLEKYLSRFTTETIDGVNPLTYLPFVKDIWSAAQGFDIERADMSLITDMLDSIQQLVKVASKDTSDMDEDELAEHNKAVAEAIFSITDNLSSLVGLPVKNVRREFNGLINGFNTIYNDVTGRYTTAGSLGDNILEDVKDSVPVWGWLPDESKGDKLYDAIINGDTAYIERLKGAYKSDTAYQSAIRKALRDNDPRIKQAAKAIVDGEYERYTQLLNEIVGDGNFTEKDARSAINSLVNDMTPDEETTDSSKGKEESIYEVEYVYKDILDGDDVMAHAMREDIIRTHEANGKNREEAEASFNNSFKSYVQNKYDGGELTDYEARRMLVNFGGKTEEQAAATVLYWDFKQSNPDTHVDDTWISEYYADGVANAGISIEMFVDYRNTVKGIDGETKKQDRMAVINSLPISNYQKDALYYAEGWAESKLWQAPWH